MDVKAVTVVPGWPDQVRVGDVDEPAAAGGSLLADA